MVERLADGVERSIQAAGLNRSGASDFANVASIATTPTVPPEAIPWSRQRVARLTVVLAQRLGEIEDQLRRATKESKAVISRPVAPGSPGYLVVAGEHSRPNQPFVADLLGDPEAVGRDERLIPGRIGAAGSVVARSSSA